MDWKRHKEDCRTTAEEMTYQEEQARKMVDDIGADPDAPLFRSLIELAKKSYEFVVKSHPQHELVAQAQKRLDALATLK